MRNYPGWHRFEFKIDINNKVIKNLQFEPNNFTNLTERDLKANWVEILNFGKWRNYSFYINIKLPDWSSITKINNPYFKNLETMRNTRWIIDESYKIVLPNWFEFIIIWWQLLKSLKELDEMNKEREKNCCSNIVKKELKQAKTNLSAILSFRVTEEVKEKVEQAKKNLYPILTSMINSTKIEEWILWRVFVPFYWESGKKLKSDFHKLEKEWFIKIEKIFTANKEFKKEVEKIIKEWYSRSEVEEYAQEIDPGYNDNEEYNYYSIKILWNKKLIKWNYQIKYLVELDNWKKAELNFYFKTYFWNISNQDILQIKLNEVNFIN